MRIQKRVKCWLVTVTTPGTNVETSIAAYALDKWDARLIAYAMAVGFTGTTTREAEVEQALKHTKVRGWC